MTQLKNRLPLFMAAMLVVGVTLVIVAPVAAKHAKQEKETKQPATITNPAGKVVKVTASDETHYALQDAAGNNLYYLEVGPKWYYAARAYPLDKYAGQQVTVTGAIEQPNPNKPAKNPKAKQAPKTPLDAPVLEVYTVNNDKIRDAGKPPWAGGPKTNPNHPGNKGNVNSNSNGKGKATAPGQNKDKSTKPATP